MMIRLKAATLALLVLACASAARANSDPVTIETRWTQKTFSISTTGVTALTVDLAGYGAAGGRILGNTGTFNGVDGTTFGQTSVVTSTWPANAVGFGYSFLPVGGSATLKVAQTLKMATPKGVGYNGTNPAVTLTTSYNTPYPASYFYNAPVISTSAAITVPNGNPFTDSFAAQTQNPILYFTNLTAAATLYLTVDYGIPILQ